MARLAAHFDKVASNMRRCDGSMCRLCRSVIVDRLTSFGLPKLWPWSPLPRLVSRNSKHRRSRFWKRIQERFEIGVVAQRVEFRFVQ